MEYFCWRTGSEVKYMFSGLGSKIEGKEGGKEGRNDGRKEGIGFSN